jgi:SAM-dependent methyltransferase
VRRRAEARVEPARGGLFNRFGQSGRSNLERRQPKQLGSDPLPEPYDVRAPFVESVLEALLADRRLDRSDAIVAICAGLAERDLFARMNFSNVVITNLDERVTAGDQFAPFEWSNQDAHNLTFDDESFDFGFVADGLHHCGSPHRAVLELYRVSRKGIIVIESRDSLLMRTANQLNLSPRYELEAVIGNQFHWGGLNNTEIPNYIYRWTEADFKKMIRSFNPVGEHTFRFFYGLNLPYENAKNTKNNVKLYAVRIVDPILRVLTRVFRKQCNTLAMIALKPPIPDGLWPWLKFERGKIVFNREYARERFRGGGGSASAKC